MYRFSDTFKPLFSPLILVHTFTRCFAFTALLSLCRHSQRPVAYTDCNGSTHLIRGCNAMPPQSTLSESLRALNEAEAGLAQFSLSPTVAKPTAVKPSAVSPQSAAPAPVKPSPVAPQLAAYTAAANTAADAAEGEGAADQPQALRRKRSTVISRRVKEENVPASAPSDIIPAAVVTSRQEAMLLHNAVARADAGECTRRIVGEGLWQKDRRRAIVGE